MPAEPAMTGRVAAPRLSDAIPRRYRSVAWFLVGATFAALFIATVGLQLTSQAATAAEAQLAAATSTAANLAGPATAGWPDAIAARQLAAVGLLLDAGQTAAVIDVARAAGLVLALVASLLIFPITRRLGFSAPSAAAATALSAILVGLVQLFSGVDVGVVALAWLALATVITLSPVGSVRWLACVAAAVGVLTVPLAAVGLLVLGGHLVAVSAAGSTLRPLWRQTIAAALLLGAVAVAVFATGDRPLALPALSAYDGPVALPLIAVAGLVVALAWWRLDWLRPVCSAAGALLACGLIPGAGLGTVATLALPVVAVLVVALVDTIPDVLPGPALVGVVCVFGLFAAASTVGVTLGSPRTEAGGSLSSWIAGQLDPAQVVRVDELTAAELVRDGIAADRLRSIADPEAPADAVVVLSERRGAAPSDAGSRSELLARFETGPGRAPAVVYLPGGAQTADVVRDELADRARFGTSLASNPKVSTPPEVVAALRAGDVDPRLMTVIAALTAAHTITVAELLTVAGEPPGSALRTAVITTFDDRSTSDPATAEALGQWLARQLPPYTPTLTPRAGEPIRVSFPAPSPLGLLVG